MALDHARSCSGDASETKCLRRLRTSMEDASAKPGKSDSQPNLARGSVTAVALERISFNLRAPHTATKLELCSVTSRIANGQNPQPVGARLYYVQPIIKVRRDAFAVIQTSH